MKKRCQIPGDSVLKGIQGYFRMLCNCTDAYLLAMDMVENIVMVSPNMVTKFGMPAEVFRDMEAEWIPRIHPDDCEGFLKDWRKAYTPQNCTHNAFLRVRDIKDNYVWVRCRGQMSFDSGKTQHRLFVCEIMPLDLNGQADSNTGLLSKSQFEQDLKATLVYRDGAFPTGALMIFGLDNFKIINESYNRHFGNIMLQIAAKTIAMAMPPGTRLYRLDGDEFATIIPDIDEEGAQRFFDGVQKAFCHPHLIEGRHLFCTLSAGTVLYPQGGKDYLVLYKHGEATLDQAKREGKNKNVFFTKEKYNRWLRSLSMWHFLQDSIDANFAEFSLLYQPQMDTFSQKLIGAEALLRWRSPRGRMVSPMEFIRILEETKMIIPVGRWVLETAVRQCKEWQKKWPGLQISVNISYEQIKESGFEEMVLECLQRYELPPSLLVLELTESAIVSDWNNINGLFSRLRSHGVKVALDDFGTGYSSLGYLKNLVCDIVKIDRVFVLRITDEDNDFDRRLVKATIELCHSAGIACCIEGVEHKTEYVMLRDFCGADVIQGYYFGRPEMSRAFEEKFFTEKFSGED